MVRKYLMSRGTSIWADRAFYGLMVLCALSIFGLVVLIVTELLKQSHLAWVTFGLKFFFQSVRDPYTNQRILGSGEWTFQRPSFCLRHAGFVTACAGPVGSAGR